MYPLWNFLHAFLLFAGTGALAVAAVLARRRVERSRAAASVALVLVVGALVAVPAQVGVLLALASYGPDFALEKIPLGVPLALVPLVAAVAVPGLSRAAAGQPGPRAAGTLAVRLALLAQLLGWHLFLVPPTSTAAVLGTGLAYAAVLVVGVPLLRPRNRSAPATGRAVRVVGGGLVAVAAAGLAVTVADRANRAPAAAHPGHAGLAPGQVDVASLTGPTGTPDRAVMLTARRVGGRWTFDGTVPGPELRFREGELVQVTLVNQDVPGGVTLHWHGLDVPNAEDGVAGVTQDAVPPGGRYVYRFRPEQVGTFWYHSHQASSEQVARGLFGVLVIEPRQPGAGEDIAVVDHPRVAGTLRRDVAAGTPVRLRVVNAANQVGRYSLAGVAYRIVAVDGTDLHGPTEITGERVSVAAGGRSTANHPMHLHGHHALVVSRDGEPATGSPWWTDTLEVDPGETYVLLFRADNPGIWMDHCHNLNHARAGLVLHLAYEGVGTRFQVGPSTGNQPE